MGNRSTRISSWEWGTAAVATALVISMVVTLLLAGRREQTPPRFALTIESVAAAGADFLVQFSIRNEGHKTAAQVIVEGELDRGEGPPETSSVTFDYVPGGSVRHGGVLFRHDPRSGQLILRPLGFREP
jgi:uncharacterized protein (TIGR02588 family)